MPALGREYRFELSSDFRSKLDVDDAVQTALTAMTRPIAELQVRSDGGVEVRPRIPRVERVVGCRAGGSCAAMFEPNASLPGDDAFVWIVVMRADYSFPHFGMLQDHLGYIAIDALSGHALSTGILPDPEAAE